MPSKGIWLDYRLRDLSIESKNAQNGLRTRKLWSSKVGVAKLIPYTRSARPKEVGSAIFEHQMPSTGMWSDSILKDISIESKNT